MKEITVNAIKKGTVIDHIPSEYTFQVAEILGIDRMDDMVVIASNLKSSKHGSKGIIKVGTRYLDRHEVQKIALFAPDATVSSIDDYKIIEKNRLKRPKEYTGLLKCFNPNCITNREKMTSSFDLLGEKPLVIRCRYCEREMKKDDIELL